METALLVASRTPDGGEIVGLWTISGQEWVLRDQVALQGVLDIAMAAEGEAYAPCDVNDSPAIAKLTIADDYSALAIAEIVPVTGRLPCSVSVVANRLFVPSYSGARLEVFDRELDGTVLRAKSVDLQGYFVSHGDSSPRQRQSHPHHALGCHERGHVIVCDLGSDLVLTVDRQDLRVTSTTALEAGSGPRNAAALPDGRLLVACELDSTVRQLEWTGERYVEIGGVRSTGQSIAENYAGALVVSAELNVAVVANRGRSTLGVIRADGPRVRRVSEVPSGGRWPASLALDGDVLYVANEHSGTISRFLLSDSGLTERGGSLSVLSPRVVVVAGHQDSCAIRHDPITSHLT